MDGPFKRAVKIDDQYVDITVYRKSKTVWEAVGTHHNKTYRSTGRSMSQAETAWVRQVKYHYHQN
ncbi:hypothetical protein XI02_42185 [Bradyrhizobium sp. CCBAU 21365]|nr:hypothetical protein XI02_42185 [Bradyrhizobium sp. CCBAU 21365]